MSGPDRYSIQRKIASGGMATIYLATDSVLGREVALKMVHPHLLESPEAMRRFRNEAKAVASLAHENIIKLYDFGENEGDPYLAMEFVDGVTLTALMEAAGGTISCLSLMEACAQILQGLAAAHACGMCHRDVKPDNIIVDTNGCVRITDFGIAYLMNQESLTMTGAFLGSPNYISPEQAEGRMLTAKTDIFSLGVLLYQCSTGILPFDAENPIAIINAIQKRNPVPPHSLSAKTLSGFSELVMACLAKNPEQRPDTAQCISALERVCRNLGFELGKHRLAGLVASPSIQPAAEHREVFECLVSHAMQLHRVRKRSQAMRILDEARAFGVLSREHEKLLQSSAGNSLILRMVVVVAFALVIGVIAHRVWVRDTQDTASRQGASEAFTGGHGSANDRGTPSDPDSVIMPSPAAVRSGERVPLAAAVHSPPRLTRDRVRMALVPVPKPLTNDSLSSGLGAQAPVGVSGFGALTVRTNPPWVSILVDGIEMGQTPRRSTMRLAAGAHVLRLEKDGFTPWEDSVEVPLNDTVPVTIKLVSITDHPGTTTP